MKLDYPTILINFLSEYAALTPINFPNATNQVVTDPENGHYLLVRLGWQDDRYHYNTVFHFDLKGNKVIVRRNQTDLDIVEELGAYGILEDDIQLAFMGTEAIQTPDRSKMVEHIKGILPDTPYDKNDFYHQ